MCAEDKGVLGWGTSSAPGKQRRGPCTGFSDISCRVVPWGLDKQVALQAFPPVLRIPIPWVWSGARNRHGLPAPPRF